MPPLPWKSIAEPIPDREYLFLISYLPLRRRRVLFKFMNYTSRIRAQLKETDGVVGYSLLAHVRRGDFWTLSVWESEQALGDFVRASPHAGVMSVLIPHMGKTKFLTWTARGDSVPPSWDDALQRLRTHDDARVVSTSMETVARVSDVPEGEMRAFEVQGHDVAVVNVQGSFYAFDDVCTHRQCPLHEGTLEGSTVTCGCHGSQFDVRTGEVLRGPAPVPAPTYEARVDGDQLRVWPRATQP